MESPLEVLSRAATMVQDSSPETRITSKELPTTKWRRDRRIRVSAEYHSPASPGIKPLSESNSTLNTESPIDMSVASTKPRTPPPPYREPLPGSTFATTLAARPSVITQAPKREPISNRENDKETIACESISMIDPVIDEHFRRSLGADYINIFGNNKKSPNHIVKVVPKKIITSPSIPSPAPTPPQPLTPPVLRPNTSSPPIVIAQPSQTTQSAAITRTITTVTVQSSIPTTDSVSMSVDDHFAKALGGDTWKQLKAADSCKNDVNRNSPALNGGINGSSIKN